MEIRRVFALVATVAVSLAVPVSASAHRSAAYVATVHSVTPPLPGVHVRVEKGRLTVTNAGRRTLVVLGVTGQPYLRFRRGAIDANLGPPGHPKWIRVARGRTFTWRDVRTEWIGAAPPMAVRREPGKSHHLGDWSIPLQSGGRTHVVAGSLDYTISGTDLGELLFPLTPVPLLLLLGVGIVRRACR
jgi:hypothetical protein